MPLKMSFKDAVNRFMELEQTATRYKFGFYKSMIATGLCVVFSAAVFAEIGYFNIEKKKEEILIQRRENFPSENAAKTKEIVDAAASTTRNGMRGMCFLFTGLSGAVFMYYRSRHEKSQTALREHMDFMEKEFDDFGDSVRPK